MLPPPARAEDGSGRGEEDGALGATSRPLGLAGNKALQAAAPPPPAPGSGIAFLPLSPGEAPGTIHPPCSQAQRRGSSARPSTSCAAQEPPTLPLFLLGLQERRECEAGLKQGSSLGLHPPHPSPDLWLLPGFPARSAYTRSREVPRGRHTKSSQDRSPHCPQHRTPRCPWHRSPRCSHRV